MAMLNNQMVAPGNSAPWLAPALPRSPGDWPKALRPKKGDRAMIGALRRDEGL